MIWLPAQPGKIKHPFTFSLGGRGEETGTSPAGDTAPFRSSTRALPTEEAWTQPPSSQWKSKVLAIEIEWESLCSQWPVPWQDS